LAEVMATIKLLSRYGSKSAYDTGIGVNSTSFFCCKIPSLVGVLVCAKGGVWHWLCGSQALWLT